MISNGFNNNPPYLLFPSVKELCGNKELEKNLWEVPSNCYKEKTAGLYTWVNILKQCPMSRLTVLNVTHLLGFQKEL